MAYEEQYRPIDIQQPLHPHIEELFVNNGVSLQDLLFFREMNAHIVLLDSDVLLELTNPDQDPDDIDDDIGSDITDISRMKKGKVNIKTLGYGELVIEASEIQALSFRTDDLTQWDVWVALDVGQRIAESIDNPAIAASYIAARSLTSMDHDRFMTWVSYEVYKTVINEDFSVEGDEDIDISTGVGMASELLSVLWRLDESGAVATEVDRFGREEILPLDFARELLEYSASLPTPPESPKYISQELSDLLQTRGLTVTDIYMLNNSQSLPIPGENDYLYFQCPWYAKMVATDLDFQEKEKTVLHNNRNVHRIARIAGYEQIDSTISVWEERLLKHGASAVEYFITGERMFGGKESKERRLLKMIAELSALPIHVQNELYTKLILFTVSNNIVAQLNPDPGIIDLRVMKHISDIPDDELLGLVTTTMQNIQAELSGDSRIVNMFSVANTTHDPQYWLEYHNAATAQLKITPFAG
jgi:hypothetical protein